MNCPEQQNSKFVFISYARRERKYAEEIKTRLEHNGINAWMDTDTPVGVDWRPYIEDKLNDADCILVLWSKISFASNWVLHEASRGLQKRNLLPVNIENFAPEAPYEKQCVSMVGWRNNRTKNFKAIVNRLVKEFHFESTTSSKDLPRFGWFWPQVSIARLKRWFACLALFSASLLALFSSGLFDDQPVVVDGLPYASISGLSEDARFERNSAPGKPSEFEWSPDHRTLFFYSLNSAPKTFTLRKGNEVREFNLTLGNILFWESGKEISIDEME